VFFLFHKTTRPTGRLLAKALGIRRFGSVVKAEHGIPDFLIRWGNAMPVRVSGPELNPPQAISNASNKLRAFRKFTEAEVSIPRFTDSRYEAIQLQNEGYTIFGRTVTGSKGRGIVIYPPGAEVGHHQLYTAFIPNVREYRLHVVSDSVIRTQRKYPERVGAREDAPIKNVEHGFVFKAPQNKLHKHREDLAINACKALGLDFGAVDMVIDHAGTAYVLEINTAPACSPMTGTAYVTALRELVLEKSNGEYDLATNLEALKGASAHGEIDPRNRVMEAMFHG
jgi:glutathione synthase/RimK-type ligase-like ATP-grasp enzyme